MQSLTLPTYDLYSKLNRFANRQREGIIYFISMAFVFLFVYTANAKLTDHSQFEKMLAKTQVVGPFASLFSWLIPISEIIISLLLLIPVFIQALEPTYSVQSQKITKGGLWAALILMVIFTIYLSGIYLFAEHHLCHCGGVIEAMGWKTHIAFNFFFIASAVAGIKLCQNTTPNNYNSM